MIERVHEHIISELKANTITDTIFVIVAIFLNLLTLGINSGVAAGGGRGGNGTTTIIMFTFVALLIVVNLVAEVGLIKGRQTRMKLLDGLLRMYKDQKVDGYYDASLLSNYNTRYNLFLLTVVVTGLIALVVPLVIIIT